MSLRVNSRGAQVSKLQAELKAAGISPGKIDGVFGRGTQAAVKRYQAKYRLSVDGVVGPRTWNKLLRRPGVQVARTQRAGVRVRQRRAR